MFAAEAELCRREEPIHDHVIAPDAIVHELGAAFRADPRAAASRLG
jgi:hypothetical protein